MIKFIRKYWEILIILALGLTPLLWYKFLDSLALGHDMGFPLNPIIFFKDRLFVWTDRVGLGMDQTLGSAAVLIHGLEALIKSFGFSIFTTQKIVFVFWFVLPGLAMYYFVSSLHEKKEEWFIRLSASLFYMFNHFLLQAWFMAERTKFSLVVALPLLLALIIKIIERKIPLVRGLSLVALILFFFNGGGGIPLYGGIILTISLALVFFGVIQVKIHGRKEISRLAILTLFLLTVFLLVNSFWFLPLISRTVTAYGQSLASIGGISGVIAWSSVISKSTSFLNLLRLQGIPDWYENPLHPYSGIFLNNLMLILASFLIPIIVFSSLFIVRKVKEYRPYVLFFALLALVAAIFTAGSHPPFGGLYNALLAFVPGFAVFRTPFYKFGPALWFSYAYLFSFSLYFLLLRFKRLRTFLWLTILILIPLYSFPFFTGIFFAWQKPLSTMVKFPSYVLDSYQWINKNLSYNDRILTFPSLNPFWKVDFYKWGYWSIDPLSSLLTERSIVTSGRVLSSAETKLVKSIYDSFLEETPTWAKATRFLGVNHFLLYNDFEADFPDFKTANPEVYREKFASLGLEKERVFGPWEIFKIENQIPPKRVFVEKNVSLILSRENLLEDQLFEIEDILNLPLPDGGNFYFTNKNSHRLPFDVFSRMVFLEKCLFCEKKQQKIPLNVPESKIIPGSIFYPLIRYKEEKERIKFAKDVYTQIDFSLGTSLKRIAEIKQLVDLKREEKTIISTLGELKKEIEELESVIDGLDKNQEDIKSKVLRVDYFLREENRILVEIAQSSSDLVRDAIFPVTLYLAEVYQKNKPHELIYPPEIEKRYNFNIELPREYEILFKNKEFGQEVVVKEAYLDNKPLLVKPVAKNDTYLSFGKKFLTSGWHQLKFFINEQDNLLKGQKSPLEFTINPVDSNCRIFKPSKIYSNKIYELNFDYLTERGAGVNNGPLVKIEQILTNQKTALSKSQLEAVNVWQTFSQEITTNEEIVTLKVSLCPSQGYEDSSVIKITNLSLKPVITPTVALILEGEKTSALPTISVERINQTKYSVNVKDAYSPYFLILNNSFNSGWKILPETSSQHLPINGFANSWLIDKPGSYFLVLEYLPQRYFYLGWGITIIFLVLVISYLVLKYVKKT